MTDPLLPRVSVIVPHYRDFARLHLCLESLGRQSYPAGLTEIIVADNNSPEGVAAVAAAVAGRAAVVVVTEKGAGPARNGGAAAATGEVLAFIDSDCIAEPEWVAEGVRALASYDFIGGRMKVLVGDMARMTPAEAFERVFAFDNEDYITNKSFTVSANLMCPRSLFESVGGFRTTVSEDVEWAHRAIGLGYRLGYASRAVVGHPARRTWSELIAKWRRMTAESYALITERRGGRALWLLRSLVLPASAVAHTPKVLASGELQRLDQRTAAIGILFRLRLWRMFEALRLAAKDASR